jgi:DNA polymerase-4
MPTIQAMRLCPQLVLVPPDRPLYQRLHRQLQDITEPVFPGNRVDEYRRVLCRYDETTDPPSGSARVRAGAQNRHYSRHGPDLYHCSGVRQTVAKIAADAHKPDGLAVIEPGTEAAFLAPLPIRSLPGMGPKSTEAIERLGLHTIGDLLEPRFEQSLLRLLGTRLAAFQSLARGRDSDPVVADREAKSVSHETTFDEDTNDPALLEPIIHGFLETLTHDLRLEGLAAGSFTVKLKDSHFRITTRQRTFPSPANYDPDMWPDIRLALAELLQPPISLSPAGPRACRIWFPLLNPCSTGDSVTRLRFLTS